MNWHKLENKKPIASQSGDWDGLKSDKVLVATRFRKIYIATLYEGTLDGSKFSQFYDETDGEIDYVIFWTELDLPF